MNVEILKNCLPYFNDQRPQPPRRPLTNLPRITKQMMIKEWISYEEAENYKDSGIGGLGGWFNWREKGQRWKDYLDIWKDEAHPYFEALRQEILSKDIREGGDWHQSSEEGVPLFEDDTVATFSYRAWGDLLAAIYSEKENKDYTYMDFYMSR